MGTLYRTDGSSWLPIAVAQPTSVVSSLPASPYDDQEVFYVADSTNGAIWHLKYRAASSSTYKWGFVGGASLISQQIAQTSTSFSTSTWGTATGSPTLTVPLAGDYEVDTTATLTNGTGGASYFIGVRVGATDPVTDTNTAAGYGAVGSARQSMRLLQSMTGLASGTVLLQRQWHNEGTTINLLLTGASMALRPVRVG